jgi:hypothetical protein
MSEPGGGAALAALAGVRPSPSAAAEPTGAAITAPAEAGEDSAWTMVPTALAAGELLRQLDDPERLLRVNPHWNFAAWELDPDESFRLRVRDTLADRSWETSGRIERHDDGLRLVYADGLKAATRFRIEADGPGARLWVIDDYGRLPAAERAMRLDEVDRTLPAWGEALGRYCAGWRRWHRWPPWRWYMERVWRRMTPLARRIARLLIWISVIELAVFVLLVAVLALEQGR